MALTIGVLLARSDIYPRLTIDVISGVRWGIAHYLKDHEVKVCIENIGLGNSKNIVESKIQNLYLQHDADIVIGVTGSAILQSLQKQIAIYKKPFFAIDGGAMMPRYIKPNPFIIQHSMELWKGIWLQAAHICQHIGKRIIIAQDFYEAGTHLGHAFEQGMARAGASLVGRFITRESPLDVPPEVLAKLVKDEQAEVVLGLYSGEKAGEFLEYWQKTGLAGKVALWGYPFLTEFSLLEDLEDKAIGVQDIASWGKALPSSSPEWSYEGFEDQFDEWPLPYAILAYEAVMFYAEGLKQCGKDRIRKRDWIKMVDSLSIEGPRGRIEIDGERYATKAPFYLRTVEEVNGEFIHTIGESLGYGEDIEALLHDEVESPTTGWINPFLCI